MKIPKWLVMYDGGVRCQRCGKAEPMPQPMPTEAFTPWCEYIGALHGRCVDTGRVDVPPAMLAEWVKSHDTGVSSRAIYRHMMGFPRLSEGHGDHPHDPSDFGRCYRLLALEPAWRARIGEMARYSREWASLARAWDELTALYEAVLASGATVAPALSARMRDLTKQQAA